MGLEFVSVPGAESGLAGAGIGLVGEGGAGTLASGADGAGGAGAVASGAMGAAGDDEEDASGTIGAEREGVGPLLSGVDAPGGMGGPMIVLLSGAEPGAGVAELSVEAGAGALESVAGTVIAVGSVETGVMGAGAAGGGGEDSGAVRTVS